MRNHSASIGRYKSITIQENTQRSWSVQCLCFSTTGTDSVDCFFASAQKNKIFFLTELGNHYLIIPFSGKLLTFVKAYLCDWQLLIKLTGNKTRSILFWCLSSYSYGVSFAIGNLPFCNKMFYFPFKLFVRFAKDKRLCRCVTCFVKWRIYTWWLSFPFISKCLMVNGNEECLLQFEINCERVLVQPYERKISNNSSSKPLARVRSQLVYILNTVGELEFGLISTLNVRDQFTVAVKVLMN